jgi:hypothetical protein
MDTIEIKISEIAEFLAKTFSDVQKLERIPTPKVEKIAVNTVINFKGLDLVCGTFKDSYLYQRYISIQNQFYTF